EIYRQRTVSSDPGGLLSGNSIAAGCQMSNKRRLHRVSIGRFVQTPFPVLISLFYRINVLTGGNWGKVPNWHLFLLLPYRNPLLIYL
ncbi:hypothetical protein, partial [Sporofaciens musculi]|uniref:hypothetical protein n=1 Tax=Sporofaciens musculi TaxID=2681861 RepID=UPI002570DF3B